MSFWLNEKIALSLDERDSVTFRPDSVECLSQGRWFRSSGIPKLALRLAVAARRWGPVVPVLHIP